MKGLILTIDRQDESGVFWTQQDHIYLPRLLNFLNVEYSEYEWKSMGSWKLDADNLQGYQAVAVTPLTMKYKERVQKLQPTIKIVTIDTERFMRMLAPKGAVIGRTTGYVITQGPQVNYKDRPKTELSLFDNDSLRQLMRDYPKIYWTVESFDDVKRLLAQNAKNVTVGLAPQALSYEKYLQINYPEAEILHVAPKKLLKTPKYIEGTMLLITVLTMFLLILLVFFQ